jgi:N-acetylneuraminic acid mutarotase
VKAIALLAAALVAACGDDDGGGASADASGGDTGWERLADLPSGPVQETAVVEVAGVIYVLGGIDGAVQTLPQVLAYHPADDSWDSAPDLPAAVHHVNAAAVEGTIYVVGSLAPDFSPVAEVWSWTPGDQAWSTGRMPMPAPARGAAAVGVVDGVILVAGGLAATGSSDVVSAYDPAADSWDQAPAHLPMPLDHATGQVVDGAFFVIGGRSNGITAVSAAVWRNDATGWTARAPMPTARGGIASGVVDGRIAVVGGEGNPDADSGVFPQTEIYDPDADAWDSLADMPTPRHGMAAAGLDGGLYVPGGADHQSFGAVATHEVLRLR